jgi:hypothetical protein
MLATDEWGAVGGIRTRRPTPSTSRKPLPLATLSTTNKLICDRTGTTAIGSQRICYITKICIDLITYLLQAGGYPESGRLRFKTCTGKVTYIFTFSFMWCTWKSIVIMKIFFLGILMDLHVFSSPWIWIIDFWTECTCAVPCTVFGCDLGIAWTARIIRIRARRPLTLSIPAPKWRALQMWHKANISRFS